MAWRFKVSKYKNAMPILPKAESCVQDICVGYYQTYGNNIASSAAFMAFNWEHTGSSIAVLPLDDCGRKSKDMPLLNGHTDTVTDLEFSPFHDRLLATASQDTLVKIWHIPEKGLETSLTEPECVFSHKQRRVETLGFHPTADGLLYSTAAGCVTLFDISTKKELFSNNEHPDVIQSASWCRDGRFLATSCKDKNVRIFDPRSTSSPIQMTAESHQSIKDSRVIWLGSQPRILTTGFNATHVRQVIIRDIRNFGTCEQTLELDCSTGILMPLFDADTNMLFLAGKGDTVINYFEVNDKVPYLIEGFRHTGKQTKGACLVPKRALKVMEAEVNRVLQVTANSVIPIMYQVPRKTYINFHADLYPDTAGYRTELMANEWFNGTNMPVQKMQLDPAKRELGDATITIHHDNLRLALPSQPRSMAMESPTKNSTDSSEETSLSMSSPPQPMPRTLLHNSLENVLAPVGGTATFMMSKSPASSSGVTRPRPRTTTTLSSYKPRPGLHTQFSSNSADVACDKVFAFPLAQRSQENIEQFSSSSYVTTATAAVAAETSDDVNSVGTTKQQPLPMYQAAEDTDNGNCGINSNNDTISKTFSTLELHKTFERNSESSKTSIKSEDKPDAECSSTINQSSITSNLLNILKFPKMRWRRGKSKLAKPSNQQTEGNSNAKPAISEDNKGISVPEDKRLRVKVMIFDEC